MNNTLQLMDKTHIEIRCVSAMTFILAVNLLLLVQLRCDGAYTQATESQRIHPSMVEDRVCLSLRVMAKEAVKIPLRKEVENLAGIGWLEGFVIDPDNHDVILIGKSTTNWPTLHIDDLVVNIRNVWNRESYPYCSLDPQPENILKINNIASRGGIVNSVDQMNEFFNQIKKALGPQKIVVGGVPRNSRHAHVMINADYHMKKLSQGLINLKGIHSYIDIMLADAKKRIEETGQIPMLGMSMSRFWFHVGKGEPTYQEGKGIICLDKCSVVLLTEKQRATADGRLYDSYEDDKYAHIFAQELSERFPIAATLVPEYADLENLFRLSAVLWAMHFRNAVNQSGIDFGYWMKDYSYKKETVMLPSLPGLANFKKDQKELTKGGFTYQYVLFPITCGGVSMEITIDNHKFADTKRGQLERLREAVLKSRPGPDALFWKLSMIFN